MSEKSRASASLSRSQFGVPIRLATYEASTTPVAMNAQHASILAHIKGVDSDSIIDALSARVLADLIECLRDGEIKTPLFGFLTDINLHACFDGQSCSRLGFVVSITSIVCWQ